MFEPSLSRCGDFHSRHSLGVQYDYCPRPDNHRQLRKQILHPIDDARSKRKKRRGLFHWKWINAIQPSYKPGKSTANMYYNADSDG